MDGEEFGEKCICQLCNCGIHRCPHSDDVPSINSADTTAMNGSEYSEMYEAKNIAGRMKPFHPEEDNLKREFDYPTTRSTIADDFKTWQVRKPIIYKPNKIYTNPTGAFFAETTNTSEVTSKHPSRVKSTKQFPTGIARQFEPFIASSIQKSDFIEKKAQRSKSYKPMSSYERSNDPLSAVSVSQADYVQLQPNKAKILKPKSRHHGSNAPFEGITEQRSNFSAKEFDVAHGRRPKTQNRLMSGPAEIDTTYSLGYKAVQGGRQQPYKPPQVRNVCEGDFDGITTSKAEFGQKKNKICPAEYILSRRSEADGHCFYVRTTKEEE